MRVFQSSWFIFICKIIVWALALKGYDLLRLKINIWQYFDSKLFCYFLEFCLLCVFAVILDKCFSWFQSHVLFKSYQNK